MIFVWNTTVHRTNGSTLRLFVEAFTLGAFVWNDVVVFVRNWLLGFVCSDRFTIGQNKLTF
jgi:hypothetical protein